MRAPRRPGGGVPLQVSASAQTLAPSVLSMSITPARMSPSQPRARQRKPSGPKPVSSAPLAALLPALPAMHIVKAECSGCSFALLTHMLAPSLQVRWPGSPSFCVHGLLEMRLISTLLLLPRCPPLEKMRGRAPLWSSAAHLFPTGGLSTCSLVYFLVAFLSTPRSSPPYRL